MAALYWFRYINGATEVSERLHAAILRKSPSVQRQIDRSLRGTDYDHVLSRRNVYEIEVGADELQDEDKLGFMEGWWTADARAISFDTGSTEPADNTFVFVTTSDGDAPVTYIDGLNAFPEYAFQAVEKYRA